MNNNAGYVKGQKVITPSGEGHVVDTIGDKIVVQLPSGETAQFAEADLEDDSDAG